jgi:uncharacterized NAD(P)/FAD-binding protein YdhS
MRPITQALWQRMDRDTQHRFLRHARAWWDVHRHRIPADVHGSLRSLIAAGRLKVLAGSMSSSKHERNHYCVAVRLRGSEELVKLHVGLVINCTGPLSNLRHDPNRLITQMLADGLLQVDGLNLGAAVDENDRLVGFLDAYAIGPIARGRYWEITAVPDLRTKAAEIARAIAEQRAAFSAHG